MKTFPKSITAAQAVEAIKSDDNVVLGNFCSEPRYLPMALMERARELSNVRLFHMSIQGIFAEKYLVEDMEKHIRCVTPFCGRNPIVRQLIRKGKADYYPVSFSKIPDLLRHGDFKADVFMTTIAPPDNEGYCNLGISVDYAWGAIEHPHRTIIAEINTNMPRTKGKTALHISKIDYVIEVNDPLYELPQSPITDIEKRIGSFVAELVEDGATLQIGYGSTSESVIYSLKDKKNLGIHTEMVPEGLRELITSGTVNNSQKRIHRGKTVCTFNAGTNKLYTWLNNNPVIEMYPVDYTNNPKTIASNNKLVAINTALQVDLYGNIYADIFGLEDQYSGAGGQIDFAIGCSLSDDAKFITVLSSTSKDGKISRIVTHPSLEINNPLAPQIPTVSRYYSDYVVTEYGIAHLRGKTNRERAYSLINIAHPEFRDILAKQAHDTGLLS